MRVLVTGVAGFIGMHVAAKLVERGEEVIGLDNLNNYYNPALKRDRLEWLGTNKNFRFIYGDISDRNAVEAVFSKVKPNRVVNLAAQAGVRYSLKNPHSYIDSNIVGFCNILEGCRNQYVEHLVYASSSSVYGANSIMPYSVTHNVDHPLSLYAASKKANELMAHSYSHLYRLPTTGLRYFTVYGPWGRPDMSPWLFTSAILERRPIDIFNYGKMKRDFTYIEDIAEGTVKALDKLPSPSDGFSTTDTVAGRSNAPYRIYNIGNNSPVDLLCFIETIEGCLGIKAMKNYLPMQSGDVIATCADIEELKLDMGYTPNTSLETGIKKWIDWYRSYHKL